LENQSGYPKAILEPIENQNARFFFTDSATYLLHKLSGLEIKLIKECQIIKRGLPYYLPWYKANKGGGAITLGNRKWSRIVFTENFFSSDTKKYNGRAYSDNIDVWLRMASHEIIHIEHAQRFRSLIIYLIIFIWQYMRFGHDKSPLEKEADQCTSRYYDFDRFLKMKYNTDIARILTEDKSEAEKINTIDFMWNSFSEPVA